MFTRGNMFDFSHSPGSAPALKLRTSASAQLAGSCSRMDLFIEAPNKQGGWLINSLIREFGINMIREFGINKKWINTYVRTYIHIKIYQELINTAVSLGIGRAPPCHRGTRTSRLKLQAMAAASDAAGGCRASNSNLILRQFGQIFFGDLIHLGLFATLDISWYI